MHVQGKPSGKVSEQVGKRALNDESKNGAARNITLRVGGGGSQAVDDSKPTIRIIAKAV